MVSGAATFVYIDNPGTYSWIAVRIRSVMANGTTSAWLNDEEFLGLQLGSSPPHPIGKPRPLLTIGGTAGPIFTFNDSGATLDTLEPSEAGSDKTLNHVTSVFASSSARCDTGTSGAAIQITGLSFNVTVKSSAEVYNFYGTLLIDQYLGTAGDPVEVSVYVDGVPKQGVPLWPGVKNQAVSLSPVFTITGLTGSAGGTAHTITFWMQAASGDAFYLNYTSSGVGVVSGFLMQKID